MGEQLMAFEEVPGSRTTQQAIDQPQRERIAYEELQPGTEVQAGDQYRNTQGRWVEYSMNTSGVPIVGPTAMARRPYKISTIQEIGDALADAQRAATQLQDERDELKTALRDSHAAHEFTMKQGLATIAERNQAERLLAEAIRERDKAWSDQRAIQAYRDTALQELAQAREANQQLLQTITDNADQFANAGGILQHERDEARRERDLARLEVARVSTELWARKPLEDRVSSLTHELANARERHQQLLKTIAENADMFGDHTAALVRQRDGFDAEVQRLQEVVGNLYSEPTARQVQDMLRTWATELDWSADCFDSAGRDKVSAVQRVLIAVIERIEGLINPEGDVDGE